jgi:hypothetical protein
MFMAFLCIFMVTIFMVTVKATSAVSGYVSHCPNCHRDCDCN